MLIEILSSLQGDSFMPHGMCYLWRPGLLWTHVAADAATAMAYWAIPPTLAVFVLKARRESLDDSRLPYEGMFLAFALFIVACGLTHFFAIVNVWRPTYWVSGGAKVLTAAFSVATALALPPLVPKALDLFRSAQSSERRRVELENANQQLESLNNQLKDLIRFRTEFFANVSHELKTPLTLVTGPLDSLLAEGNLSREDRARLEVVRRNADSVLNQVMDLLDLSRLEAGRIDPSKSPVNASQLLSDVIALYPDSARSKDVQIVTDLDPDANLMADARLIGKAMNNIVSNAVKFTPRGGTIRIECATTGNRCIISVEDSGAGVREEDRERIFQRYVQGDQGPDRTHAGTGLGLAIAREFVRAHGGEVSAGESELGGARFVIDLPVGEKTSAAHDSTAPLSRATSVDQAAEPVVEESGTGETTVYVVEDNVDMGRYIAASLAEECRVIFTNQADRMLDDLQQRRIDLIVSDFMMPEMSGERLLDAVRKNPSTTDIPVLMVTARSEDGLAAHLLDQGANDLMRKPFTVSELQARVRRLISVHRSTRVLQSALQSTEADLETLAWQLAQQSQELESLASERATLLAELHHRVKGNLQTISSLLRIQAHETEDATAREALLASWSRVQAMAGLHERLYQRSAVSNADLNEYIKSLCEQVHGVFDPAGVVEFVFRANDRPLRLDIEDSIACGLLIHELMTNALRHAFIDGERESPLIEVSVREATAGTVEVSVADNGVGFTNRDRESEGLGLQLVRDLANQLDATIDIDSSSGTRVTIAFTRRSPNAQF